MEIQWTKSGTRFVDTDVSGHAARVPLHVHVASATSAHTDTVVVTVVLPMVAVARRASRPAGPAGPQGPEGPQGPTGEASVRTDLRALVARTQGIQGSRVRNGPIGPGDLRIRCDRARGSLLYLPAGIAPPAGYAFVGSYQLELRPNVALPNKRMKRRAALK